MTRDPRTLDQIPLVIDPANVDAVLNDRPSPAAPPLKAPLDETSAEYSDKPDPKADQPPDNVPLPSGR